jgi:hypothetical protein
MYTCPSVDWDLASIV